jgi:hypothetical protein
VASVRNIVDGNFALASRVIDDDARGCEVVFDGINNECRVNMQSQDVPKKCSTSKDNRPTFPVAN